MKEKLREEKKPTNLRKNYEIIKNCTQIAAFRVAKADKSSFYQHFGVLIFVMSLVYLTPWRCNLGFVISEKYGDEEYEEYAVNEYSDISEKRFPKGNKRDFRLTNFLVELRQGVKGRLYVQKIYSAIIVGVRKCGTRALLQFCGLHPQIVHAGDVKSHRKMTLYSAPRARNSLLQRQGKFPKRNDLVSSTNAAQSA